MKIVRYFHIFLFTLQLLMLVLPISTYAGVLLDFSRTTVYTTKKDTKELQKVIQVLQEEIWKRSGMTVNSSRKITATNPQIIVSLEVDNNLPETYASAIAQLESIGPEGYKIAVLPSENKVIIHASTKRGALYGIGKLLRSLEIRTNEILVPESLNISSTPRYEIRGHQLGYRPKTNSYDAWSVAQFDQYIRELAIFGANSIEIMPPRTDDDFTSRHMQIPAIDMIKEQSRICDEYDLDVWMWYPNMGTDYQNPDSIKNEIEERHQVFSNIPRLDHLFVPGGDPGDLEPDILFSWLEQVSQVLHQYHPDAKIWISPQVFRPTKAWLDTFFNHINQKPEWLGGVVFGPWVKPHLKKSEASLMPISLFADIPTLHTF